MNKLTITIALAAILAARNLRGDTPELPTYTYAVQAPHHQEAGLILTSMHFRMPDTIWTCDIKYKGAGLVARCSTPSLDGGLVPEIAVKVSCEKSDVDSETVDLSTFDSGVYAILNISCKRNLYDDGF
jgi:hypothetical protein